MRTLVEYHVKFNKEFPEDFTWGMVNSMSLSNLAEKLSREVHEDLRTIGRHMCPGLRESLRQIASMSYIENYCIDNDRRGK